MTDLQPIRTIDPDDEDFSDLVAVADAIGDARVVLLGEQSHGDGAAFLWKTRLIKFLYRELGFDVLAWEAGVYDCHRAETALDAGEPPLAALDRGIHQVWITKELESLAEFHAQTRREGRPLRCAGFDCQFSSRFSWDDVGTDLQRWFEAAVPGSVSDADAQTLTWLAASTIPFRPQAEGDERRRARDLLRRLTDEFATSRDAFVQAHGAHRAQVIERTLLNFEMNEAFTYDLNRLVKEWRAADQDSRWPIVETDERFKKCWNDRDTMMAANLVWIAEDVFPGQKVMGWLANGHATRNLGSAAAPDDRFQNFHTLGDLAYQHFGDDLYFIASDAYGGEGVLNTGGEVGPIPPPSDDSIEALMAATGAAYGFLDLRRQPADSPYREVRPGRIYGQVLELSADWSQVADGVLYLEEMTISSPAGA